MSDNTNNNKIRKGNNHNNYSHHESYSFSYDSFDDLICDVKSAFFDLLFK